MESSIIALLRVVRAGLLVKLLLLAVCSVWLGCSRASNAPTTTSSSAGQGVAWIKAEPNPVPAGPTKFGKTTVTWDTGSATPGEVYVATNGKDEKRFSGALAKGSQEAAWIGKGEYEFRLYQGKEHKAVLGTVKVVRSQ